jgi:hypothetical protein
MSDNDLVNLQAGDLVKVVDEVLADTSPLAVGAQVVADEIIRLRDAGQLSKWVASEIHVLIYQRQMHSSHIGDFDLTAPIRALGKELELLPPAVFPAIQQDPVQVTALFAEIAAHIRRR